MLSCSLDDDDVLFVPTNAVLKPRSEPSLGSRSSKRRELGAVRRSWVGLPGRLTRWKRTRDSGPKAREEERRGER